MNRDTAVLSIAERATQRSRRFQARSRVRRSAQTSEYQRDLHAELPALDLVHSEPHELRASARQVLLHTLP